MDSVTRNAHEQVIAATRGFVDALKATGVARRFTEATRRFESDTEVQGLLDTLQRFQRAQRTGEILAEGVEDIRKAQVRLQAHPVVNEFLAARDALGSFLQEANVEMSQVLGVNFGQTAGPAGGSC